jgi:rubrerythrin
MSSNKLSKQNLQTEVDAAWLYQKLAENESDETVAYIFRQMSEIESGHAHAFLAKPFTKADLLKVLFQFTNHEGVRKHG